MDSFEKELTYLLNRHGWDNAVNTYDFVLAKMLVSFLSALEVATLDCERLADEENGALRESKP